jgi:seryl-tRNA synthetase
MSIPRVSGTGVSPLDTVLRPTAADGVHARTSTFELVMHGLGAFITRHRPPDAEALSFPPVMSRAQLETSGYLTSFPHLLGCVSGLHGDEGDVRSAFEGRASGREWTAALEATDVVLTPAACYPLYPLVAEHGDVPASGARYDVDSYCFRRETSAEPGRLQSFRMREFVCIGSPQAAQDFRRGWIDRADRLMGELGLPYRLAPASDPFFGRVGRIMALDQVERALKFELLIPIVPGEEPTACMSFNYHHDHFGKAWGLTTQAHAVAHAVAHTACVAFGLERLCIALFAVHGLELGRWPESTRAALSL